MSKGYVQHWERETRAIAIAFPDLPPSLNISQHTQLMAHLRANGSDEIKNFASMLSQKIQSLWCRFNILTAPNYTFVTEKMKTALIVYKKPLLALTMTLLETLMGIINIANAGL